MAIPNEFSNPKPLVRAVNPISVSRLHNDYLALAQTRQGSNINATTTQ